MRITNTQQDAINEVAKMAYVAEQANKAKTKALHSIQDFVDKNKDEFHDGIEAKFELEGKTIACKLTMNPSPKWQVKDAVVIVEVTE